MRDCFGLQHAQSKELLPGLNEKSRSVLHPRSACFLLLVFLNSVFAFCLQVSGGLWRNRSMIEMTSGKPALTNVWMNLFLVTFPLFDSSFANKAQ